MFVVRAKQINVMCAPVPHRTRTSSMNVRMLGARRFTCVARIAKSMICTEAPAAYQYDPEMPTLQHMLDDISSVAAQVHCETISAATKPIPKLRPAVENSSEVFPTPPFPSMELSKAVMPVVRTVNAKPKPNTVNQPTHWSSVVGRASMCWYERSGSKLPRASSHTMATEAARLYGVIHFIHSSSLDRKAHTHTQFQFRVHSLKKGVSAHSLTHSLSERFLR